MLTRTTLTERQELPDETRQRTGPGARRRPGLHLAPYLRAVDLRYLPLDLAEVLDVELDRELRLQRVHGALRSFTCRGTLRRGAGAAVLRPSHNERVVREGGGAGQLARSSRSDSRIEMTFDTPPSSIETP